MATIIERLQKLKFDRRNHFEKGMYCCEKCGEKFRNKINWVKHEKKCMICVK